MINEINTFGTSFTNGGGFEFWENSKLYEFYTDEKYSIPKTQFDFSWPGKLQKIFKDNNVKIKVNNFAKSGYGHELLIRKAFDIITSNLDSLDTKLFIFEFGALGRKEYWTNELGYVITNYHFKTDDSPFTFVVNENDTNVITVTHEIAKTYFEDSDKVIEQLDSHKDLFDKFNKLSINFKTELNKTARDIITFLGFCDNLGVNYIISSNPFLPPELAHLLETNDKCIVYEGNGDTHLDMTEFFVKNKLRIIDETNGFIKDNHAGYLGNNIIANTIYNKIIEYVK